MPIDDPKDVCQHAECQCSIEPGEEFCSEYCRSASRNAGSVGEEMEDACGCGHPECDEP
ncbi:MAG: hypothetical protein JSS21_01555 [Proteobacteria bacterium]|nr:hypothetical protein [Pseudomonadota bacterium]